MNRDDIDEAVRRVCADEAHVCQRPADDYGHRAGDYLLEAADAISDRAAERDAINGERSMARAVQMFNAWREGSTGPGLSQRDGWIFMVLLKLSRARQGKFRRDDYVDAAAYCALAGECQQQIEEGPF